MSTLATDSLIHSLTGFHSRASPSILPTTAKMSFLKGEGVFLMSSVTKRSRLPGPHLWRILCPCLLRGQATNGWMCWGMHHASTPLCHPQLSLF